MGTLTGPPPLTGGPPTCVIGSKSNPFKALSRIGLDRLVYSVPYPETVNLEAVFPVADDGSPTASSRFQRVETRALGDQTVRVSSRPNQAHSKWDYGYESWDFSSLASATGAEHMPPSARATRVDVAFDFEVEDRVVSDVVRKRWQAFCDRRGIETGSAEKRGVFTHYFGAMKSGSTFVRVYRKDLHPDGEGWSTPTLRVELQARGYWAEKLGELIAGGDLQELYGVAAKVIQKRCGELLATTEVELPSVGAKPIAEAVKGTATLVSQYWARIASLIDFGLNFESVIRRTAGAVSRRTEGRQRLMREQYRDFDSPQALEDAVVAYMLRR